MNLDAEQYVWNSVQSNGLLVRTHMPKLLRTQKQIYLMHLNAIDKPGCRRLKNK